MKIRIEKFNLEIEDFTFEVLRVSDDIKHKECQISVLITTDSAKYMHKLDGFKYADTWEDKDVYEWVILELKKIEVNG